MKKSLMCLVTVILVFVGAICYHAQTMEKPKITSISGSPSEPLPRGTCTYSTSGYLETKSGERKFGDNELGQLIGPDLRKGGYVITLYPETAHGIFIFESCPATNSRK